MGADQSDFLNSCLAQNPNFEIEDALEFGKLYGKKQDEVAAEISGKADVYLLQEATTLNRPLIEKLRTRGFHFFHTAVTNPACLVALNAERFKGFENHSQTQLDGDVAIVTCIERVTNRKITFISAHAPGSNLSNISHESTAFGDRYINQLVELVENLKDSSTQILGVDMNISPEMWNCRFDLLTKKKFSVVRTGHPTNVFPCKVLPYRELDYFFYRSKSGMFSFLSQPKFEISTLSLSQIKLDPETNASDHLPIFMQLKSKK